MQKRRRLCCVYVFTINLPRKYRKHQQKLPHRSVGDCKMWWKKQRRECTIFEVLFKCIALIKGFEINFHFMRSLFFYFSSFWYQEQRNKKCTHNAFNYMYKRTISSPFFCSFSIFSSPRCESIHDNFKWTFNYDGAWYTRYYTYRTLCFMHPNVEIVKPEGV